MKENISEKRDRTRVPLRERVQISFENMENFITEYADNISSGGMFIKTDKPFPTGTRFSLELTIGKGKKINALGEVVWTKEFAPKGGRPSGMGIKFVELDGDSRKFIRELVDSFDEEGDEEGA